MPQYTPIYKGTWNMVPEIAARNEKAAAYSKKAKRKFRITLDFSGFTQYIMAAVIMLIAAAFLMQYIH